METISAGFMPLALMKNKPFHLKMSYLYISEVMQTYPEVLNYCINELVLFCQIPIEYHVILSTFLNIIPSTPGLCFASIMLFTLGNEAKNKQFCCCFCCC